MDSKQEVSKKFARNEKDTGSSEVQVGALSAEINHLTEHLRANKKDHSTRRGLIAKVTLRRKLLNYLKRTNPEKHGMLVKELDIRH